MTNGKQTNYELLKDVMEALERLESKMDRRLCVVEAEVDQLQSFRDNLLGKLAVAWFVISFFAMAVWEYIRSKLNL
jgi:hypothetical protein